MRHIVTFSGGIQSWAAAKRVVAQYGAADVTLLSADTRMEDEDNYRFLREAAENVGAPLVTVADGRTPWQVFRDQRFLGNSRVDPCSRILKRELLDAWLEDHCEPAQTTVYVGMGWTEEHRYQRLRERKAAAGWRYEAPLCEKPLLLKPDLLAWARAEGLEPSRLYALGFQHANCGGFCVKAGQAAFANLLSKLPERYAYHEQQERDIRASLGKDVAILRDRTGGETRPLTLGEFRDRVESRQGYDLFDWGGCNCFGGDAS